MVLDAAALASDSVKAELADIGHALNAGGDILLYGCDIAAGDDGQFLINDIATLTGADVAASTDATGAASLGGNWTLESHAGDIDARTLSIDAYDDVMGIATFSAANVPGNTRSFTLNIDGYNFTFTAQAGSVLSYRSDESGRGLVSRNASTGAVDLGGFTVTGPSGYTFDFVFLNTGAGPGVLTKTYTATFADGSTGTGQVTEISGAAPAELSNDITSMKVVATLSGGGTNFSFIYISINDIRKIPVVTDNNISIVSSGTGIGGAYKIGDTVIARWDNTASGDNSSGVVAATFDFSQFGGSSTASGTNFNGLWIARFTITAGNIDAVNRNVSVTASNGATVRTGTDSTNLTVDNIAPTITAGRISVAGATGTGGVYKVGDTVTVTWNNTAAGDNNSDVIVGATVNFSQFGGSVVSATNAAGIWSASYTITAGSIDAINRTALVTAMDNAGNTTARASAAVKVDNIVPTVVITTNISNLANGETATITFNFSEDPGSSFTWDGTIGDVVIVGGTLSAISGTGLSRTATFTPSANVNNGTATITVAAGSYTDVVGNSAASGASLTLTYDTLAPSAPSAPVMTSATDTGVSNSDAVTRNTTPTFTGTAEAGATVIVYDTNGITVLGTTVANGSGNWSITASVLSEGVHVLQAMAVDATGNAGPRSVALIVVIDTTPPTVVITSNVASLKVGETATITFTFSEDPGSTFTQSDIVVSGGTLSAMSGTGLTRTATFTPTASTNSSTASITVTAASYTDTAGNSGVAGATPTLIFDTLAPTAPSAPVMSSASDTGVSNSDGITSNTTPTFTGTAEAGSTVRLYDTDGVTVLGSAVATGGNWSITTSVLSQGVHTITARATDSAGNLGAPSVGVGVTIDSTSPTVLITSNVGSLKGGEIATITFTFSEDPGSTFTQGDIVVSGGTLSAISGTGLTRTAIFTPTTGINSGAASITVTAGSYTDPAGNVGGAGSTPTITFDTLAPTAPSAPVMSSASDTGISNSDGITSDTTPTFTGTAEAGATVTIYDTDGITVLGSAVATGGNWSITTSVLAQGEHALTARATDSAGNVSGLSAVAAVAIDTTPPGVTITSNVGSLRVGETAVITFNFSEDPGSTFTQGDIVVSGGTLSAMSGTGLTRTAIFTPTASTNSGTASITVTASSYTDAAGNSGAAGVTPVLTFDTLAPTAPSAPVMNSASDTGVSNSDGITSNTTPTFTGTAEVGSTVRLFDTDRTTVLGSAVVDSSGNWSITTSVLSQGVHTITARATDSAGNPGVRSGGVGVTIDTTPPSVVITSSVGSLKIGETATITFTFSEDPGSTFTQSDIVVNGGTLSAITGTGLTRTAVFTPTVGTNSSTASITVTAGSYTDTAGNIGAAGVTPALTFDTLAPNAPSAPVMSSASDTGISNSDGITSNTTPTFTGTAEAGSTVTLFDSDGITVLGSAVATGGNWSISAALGQGLHTLTTRATDSAGNVSGLSAVTAVTIDTTPPSVTITSNVGSLRVGETATITFNFSEDPGSSFTQGDIVISGGTLSAITGSGLTRTAIFTPTASTNSGTASITVTAGSYTDTAGNIGAAGVTPALTFDTLAPTAPSAPVMNSASDTGVSSSDGITSNTTPTFTGTAEAGSTVRLYDTDRTTVLGSAVANGSGNWTITTSVLSQGVHTITARATDSAGNLGARSVAVGVTIDTTQPSVVITSSVGSLKIGETATITFTFSEDPGSTFTQSDIVVSGGTLSAIVGTGSTRTAIFTPTASTNSGTASITITAGGYTDVAGNSGAAGASPVLTFDTLAPTAPSAPVMNSAFDSGVSNSDGITSNTTPTFTGTAEAGATVILYDTNGVTVLGTTVANSGGNWSITASVLGEGTHVLQAMAIDTEGNVSPRSAALVVVIDTTPPTVTITSNVASLKIGETATITFTFNEDPGSSFTQGDIVVSGGTLSAITGNGLTRTATFTPTASTNSSTASITVTAASYTDTAGNSGVAGATPTLIFDTLAPNAPSAPVMSSASDTGVSNSDGITSNISPTFTGTAEAGSTVRLYDTDGVTVLGSAVATGGNWSITTSALTQGVHTITARTTDSAGNLGAPSSGVGVTIDTTPPTVVITSNVASLKSGETATITFSFSEDPGSTFIQSDIVVNGGTLSAISGSGLTRTAIFTSTDHISSGTGSITVAAGSYSDVAGNNGGAGATPAISFNTLVPDAPSVPVMNSASDTGVSNSDGITSSTTPTFTGTAETGTTVRLYDTDGVTVLGSAVATGGNWSITVSALAQGSHILRATATDGSGNVSGLSSAVAITIDTTPPTMAITSNVASLKSGETATITFTFSEDPGSTFTQSDIVVNGGTLSAISGTGLTRTAIFTPTAHISSGTGSITVAAGSYTDVAGNNGGAGATPTISFNTLVPDAPSSPVMSSAADTGFSNSDGITSNTTPTFTGTAEAGTTVSLYDTDGVTVLGSAVATGGNWSITVSALAQGSHTLHATATDGAGNVSGLSAAAVVIIDTTSPTMVITSNVASLKSGETATITFTFSEDPGSTFSWNGSSGDVVVSGGTLSAISGTGLTRTAIFTPTAGTNTGTASITVAAGSYTDVAGNNGAAGSAPALTFDTLAPNAPSAPVMHSASDTGVSSSDGITRNTTPTFTGTAEAGSTVRLYDTDGVTVLGTAVATGGNWSITTSVLSQGGHTITARARDSAGNLGAPSAGLGVTIDTTPPTVAITSNIGSLKSGETATITFTFSEDPGSTFTQGDIVVSGGTLSAISGTGLTRTATFTPTASTNSGTASITVTAGSYTDVAGNSGSAGATPALTFDTLAPNAPSAPLMTSATDTGFSNSDGITNNPTPTFIGTAEAGATVILYDTNGITVLGTTVASVSGNWSITASVLSEGTHVLQAAAVDAAGNVSPRSEVRVVILNTTTPTLLITSNAGSLRVGETATITFNFSEDPGSTFTQSDIVISGGTLSAITGSGLTRTATFTPTASTNSSTASITVAAGSYTDVAGNSGAAGATPALTFDTLAPTAPSAPVMNSASDTGFSNSDGITSNTTPTFTGTAEAGSTVRLYDTDRTTVLGSAVADSSGNWSIATSALSQGAHTITARATDGAGNLGARSAGVGVTIDTTSPTVVITSNIGSLKIGETATITFTFSEDPGSTFAQGDIVVSGGTLSAIAGTGSTRTAIFTPTAGTNSGTASITVTAGSYTDVAGNSGAAGATPALIFDTLAPTAPSVPVMNSASDTGVSNSDGITRNTTPTFTGTAEAGATVILYDTNGITVLGTTVANGSGNWSITASVLSEGTHVLQATAIDAEGNVSPRSAAQVVVIDTTPPSVTITSNVGSLRVGETATITFTFSEDPGSTFTQSDIVITGGTLSAITGDGLTRAATFTPTASTNSSTASITVTASSYSDAAGNNGTAGVTPALIFDTLAPTAPSAPVMNSASDTGFSSSDGITRNTTPTFTGTAEAGSTVRLYDTDRTTVLGSAVADNGGNWSITTAALSQGTHTITARATDSAGNLGARSAGVGVTIDTTPPTVVITSNIGGLKIGETAVITFTFSEDPGSTFTQSDIVVSGGTLSAIAGTGSTRTAIFTPTAGTNSGTASITVTAGSYTDVAGNTGAAGITPALTFDTLAPNAPSAPVMNSASDTGVSNSDGITRNTTPTFTGTAEAGTTVILYGTNGVTVLGTAVANSSGNWSITASVLSEGTHVLQTTAIDAEGNVSLRSAAQVVVIDTTSPGLTITSNVGSLKGGETATVTFTFTEDPGSTFAQGDIVVSGGTLSAMSGTGLTRTAIFTPTVNTDSGTASITVTAGSYTDAAGNSGGASATPALTFDTLAPNAPSAPVMNSASDTGTSNSDGITSSTTPTFTGTAETGSTVRLYDTDGVTVLGSAVATGGNWSITTAALSQGVHTITARATDSAGNLGARSAGVGVTIDTTPPTVVITSNVGSLKIGETATITFTFSEDPGSTFTQGDIVVSGGTLSAMSGTGLVRTAVFTPTASTNGGTASITVTASSYTDVAGNNGVAGATPALIFDTLAPNAPSLPLMSSASDSGVSNSDAITNNARPTFTGTAEAGSTVTLYGSNGIAVLGSGIADGSGHWSITVATLIEGEHEIDASATDSAGNVSGRSSSLSVTIITTAPPQTVDVVLFSGPGADMAGAEVVSNAEQTIFGLLSAPLGVRQSVEVSLDNGVTWATADSTIGSDEWVIDVRLDTAGSTIKVRVVDLAGNIGAIWSQPYTVDTTPPVVASVTAPADGTYSMGQNLDFVVHFSEAVTVDTTDGVPSIDLTLDIGGTVQALYVSGAGTDNLVFRYAVANDVRDLTGVTLGTLSLNGGQVTDIAGNDAILTLNSVGSTAAVNVDGLDPYVLNVNITNGNGAYGAGSTITIVVTYDRPLVVDTFNGTPSFALNSGGMAIYSSGGGTSSLVFTYVVETGQNAAGLDLGGAMLLNGGVVIDAAGLQVNAQLGLSSALRMHGNIVIDTIAPAIPVIDRVDTSGLQPILGGSAVLGAGEYLTVTVGGATYGVTTAVDGTWSLNLGSASPISGTLSLVPGTSYAVMVSAIDAAGNRSSVSAALQVTAAPPSVLRPVLNRLFAFMSSPVFTSRTDPGSNDSGAALTLSSFVLPDWTRDWPQAASTPETGDSVQADAELADPTGQSTLTLGGGFAVTVRPRGLPGDGLIVNQGIADQTLAATSYTEFFVPTDAFTHVEARAAVYLSATQEDGKPLPSWVSFNPATGKFTVDAKACLTANVSVKVVAREGQGKAVATQFHIRVGAQGTDANSSSSGSTSGMSLEHAGCIALSEQIRMAAQARPDAMVDHLARLVSSLPLQEA